LKRPTPGIDSREEALTRHTMNTERLLTSQLRKWLVQPLASCSAQLWGALADRIVRGEPFRSLMTTTVSTRRMSREEVDDILSGKRHDRVAPKSCSNLMLLARVGVHHRCEFRHLLRAFACIDRTLEENFFRRRGDPTAARKGQAFADFGWSRLHTVVEALIKHRVDVDTPSSDGCTALAMASDLYCSRTTSLPVELSASRPGQ
jgi:hypothetical protein